MILIFGYAKPKQKTDTVQRQEEQRQNATGIPGTMKERFENLSGFSFDDVRVHYNSRKPKHLQALADTQGNHVFIRLGQEKHSPHELGHVLQQKARRVKPTGNIDGPPVNDDVGLERRADGYFRQNVNSVKDKFVSSQNNNSVQRKIGFEFQTNCEVAKGTPGEHKKLPKNTAIRGPGKHVNIVADDAESSESSDVEFVTIPLNNPNEIKQAYEEMVGFGKEFIAQPYEGYQWVEYNGYLLCKPEDDLEGRPQVTFGASLASIYKFAQAAKAVRGKKENPILDKVIDPKGSQFVGLVELIKSYIRNSLSIQKSGGSISYPKMITDRFMLSRTDFGKLLEMTSLTEPSFYPKNLDEWMGLFAEFEDLKIPLFPTIKESSESTTGSLTIDVWLEELYKEFNDLLSKVPDHESMCSFPELDEVTAHDGQKENVGVFELRANQGVVHKLNGEPTWSKFMEYWYAVIAETGYLPPPEK